MRLIALLAAGNESLYMAWLVRHSREQEIDVILLVAMRRFFPAGGFSPLIASCVALSA